MRHLAEQAGKVPTSRSNRSRVYIFEPAGDPAGLESNGLANSFP